MKISIFTTILLVLISIFLGLAYYAYGIFQKEKEEIEKKKIVVKVQQTMPHPPLSSRTQDTQSSTTSPISKEHNESNQTTPHIEGAEYISREELDRRLLEGDISEEKFEGEGEIIPLQEIENYPIAQTIPLDEVAEPNTPQEEMNPNIETFIQNEESNPF